MPTTAGAVLLHPHPSYGGDQHNIVVEALWRACPAAGITPVRFDFESDDLDRCTAQAVAALDDLPADVPRFLVGYSFGAAVASRVDDERVAGWVLIAPPGGLGLRRPPGPAFALVPEHDQFGPPAEVAGVDTEVVPGADHFLAGSAAVVAERAVSWMAGQVRAGP